MKNQTRKFNIFVDKTLGAVLFRFLCMFNTPKPITIHKKKIKNILIIRPGGIGDYLLSVPFFKHIKKLFPKTKIHLLCFKRNKDCLQLFSNFDKIMVIDKFPNFIKFLFMQKRYDIVFDLDQIRKIPSIISFVSKADIRVGFDTNNRGKLYTHRVCYKQQGYEAENFLNQLRWFKKINFNYNDLILTPKKSNRVNKILRSGRKVGLYVAALKAENRMSFKRWADILEKEKHSNFYLIGGKNDNKLHDEFIKHFSKYKIIRTEGKLSLSESFYLVSRLDKLYAVDGGVFHLAVCSGTPSETFWGPSIMEKWKPNLPIHKGVKSDMPCVPCTYGRFAEFKGCPYNNMCLR
jgi:ADP-heptose:LPS heptosyltransferase